MSLFKEPFDEIITAQLNARQKLIGKNEYTSEDITYLNSKTAWISLKSSVDSALIADLAKNNILLGGLLNSKSSYLIGNDALGIKPMPGITNISVKNKGAYGSLRQVTVNFQCWDVRQLEQLEVLYMRPGFTVLLEWGWLPYIDKDGNLKNTLHSDESFFTRRDVDLQDYFKDLKALVTKSEGNYDFMFGYVMNYSWKLRDDGGYDCSTEIISTGEVLESYKINFSAPEVSAKSFTSAGTLFKSTTTTVGDKYLELIRKDYNQNIIRGLCSELFQRALVDSRLSSGTFPFSYIYKENNYTIDFLSLDFTTESEVPSNGDVTSSISGDKNIYITLRDFIDLMNNFVLITNPNSPKKSNVISLSVNDRMKSLKNNDEPLKCLYHPLQISLDPSVCLIKNPNFLLTTLGNKPKKEVITYKIKDATPDQKQKVASIKTGISNNITPDELKKYLLTNIKTVDDLLSIDKEYTEKYQTSLHSELISKFDYKEINTLFGTFNFPSINDTDKPTASQFLSLSDEARKKYIQTAQDRINKTNEKIYNDTVEAISSFFEKINGVPGNEFMAADGKSGIIGNIFINLKYIYLLANSSPLESQDPAENNNIDLMNFLRTMLRDIQSSTGNVNNFEIFIEDNVGYIIDLNASNDDIEIPFEFKVGDRNSIIRSVNLESQIFSNQSSIIAISAQSDSGKLGLENSSMVAYNKGLTDRMISQKDTSLSNSSIEKKNDGFFELIKNLKEFFQGLTSKPYLFDLVNNPSLNTENVGTYKNALRDTIVFFTSQYKTANKYKSILPTKISITLDGIGGIIIGNIFDISKNVFPKSYVGDIQGLKLYYTITGIGQDVNSDGQWVTTIEGNPFIPDSSFDTSGGLQILGNPITYDVGIAAQSYINDENLNPPPTDIAGDSKNMCMAINRIFGSNNIGSTHYCARYTYSIAKNFVLAKTGKKQSELPGIIAAGGNANGSVYHDNLKKLGYKEIVRVSGINKANLASRLAATSNFRIGDVVVYWSSNKLTGSDNGHLYGHTQIYTGGIRYNSQVKSNVLDTSQPKWACDRKNNYGYNFVYNSKVTAGRLPESWNYILFRL
jgi:hypothetical protein